MEGLIQDLRYALRQIGRNVAFSFFVVATLAIGIGANTSIFGAVNALLLRGLPYEDPERLIRLSGSYVGRGDTWSVSLPNAVDWREQSRAFERMGYYQGASVTFAESGGPPERLRGVRSSADFFEVLRVRPALGRTFTADEDRAGGERVVLLSHGLWQRRFGGDPGVLGREVSLSGTSHTVIGVLPAGVSFPGPGMDVWLPVRQDPSTWNRQNGGLQVVGRLNEGFTIDEARRDLDLISARLEAAHPQINREFSAHLMPLREALYGGREVSLMLFTLLAAVAFVLLIACVNVGNLLMARATSREREVSIRFAIGAARTRVLRQLLTESMVLAVLGGVGGLLLAVFGTRVLPAMIPETLPVPRDFGIDGTVLLFTMAVTLLTGLLFGLIPALQASRSELNQLLGGRTGGSSARSRQRRRNALVVAEMALASVLLVCAGLMLRSMSGLLATDPGFDADDLLTFRVALDADYARSDQVVAFQQQVLERIRALPGVNAAGAVDWLPMGGTNNFNNFRIEGVTSDRDDNAGFVIATSGYLETMNIALLRGRFFDERDVAEAPGVVVVNEAMARRYWPDQDPLGKRLLASTDPEGAAWRTIVGVIGNVRHAGLASDPRPEMVVPYAQYGWPSGSMAFVVRTRQDPLALVEPVQRSVWAVDPAQPLYDVRTMHRVVRETNAVLLSRVTAGALALFGAVALLLAALGLYGVISFGVAQRTWEIGVRCALGAARSDVLRLVLRQGLSLVGVGLAIGLLAAFGLTRLLGSMLYGVSPRDPVSFIAVALALSAVALLATWLPARRAAGIDPATALRAE